jgi:protein-L-isoaspartate(D-aspartate) O-methyltransferase
MDVRYKNLIDSLINDGYLKTPAIIEAFKKIDRADFVLEKYKSEAYVNAPLPIGFSQTISQPLTVAFMLELLEPKKGEKILDVGAGSGWVSCLLAHIVGSSPVDEGKIVGIERISELKKMAEKNISKYNYIEKRIVEIILGDGAKGHKKEAPYDRIIAGAASAVDVPEEWKKQLKIGGRIVAPIGHNIAVIDKINKNEYSKREYFGFSFVPLISN